MADNPDKSKGMPSNRRKILFVSFGLAVLAVLLLYIYTQQLAAKYGVAGEKVSLVAAKYDIPLDKTLSHDMLMQVDVPESYVHPQSVYLAEWESITGQTVAHTVRAGQTLLWTDFADPRTDVELDQVVKEGWRALAIPVDRMSSLGGLLQPNDHVDVLGTFMKPDIREWITLTLLQNVTVLAVGAQLGSKGRSTNPEGKNKSFQTVTVLVTPEEAELLTFAIDKGKIALSLRNENDITTEVALPPKNFRDIFGEEKRNVIQKKRNEYISIIR